MEEEDREEVVNVADNDEDSSSVSSDEELDVPVFLGFPDEDSSSAPPPDELPSALGGLPVWPRIPSSSLPLSCPVCRSSMPLLSQLYAPLELPGAHHRLLSLFVCPRAACWSTAAAPPAVVLRCQWENGEAVQRVSREAACRVCGKPASKACGKCRRHRYCSPEHQAADWSAGHKRFCGRDDGGEKEVSGAASDPKMVLKRIAIVTEEEEYTLNKEAVKEFAATNEALMSDELKQKMLPPTAQESEMLKQMKKADSTFLKFQARVRDNQDQVVRYAFGARKPLWVNSTKQLIGEPPKCELCGGRRVFEFQMMPQVLFFLGVDSKEETAMDWSSLVVYSCEKSCPTKDYASEFVFVH